MKVQILLVIVFATCAHAEDVVGRHCFTFGNTVTLQEARRINKVYAVRDAIESSRLYIDSVASVTTDTVKSDVIKMLSNGTIKGMEIVSHSEEGNTVCDVITGKLDSEPFENVLNKVK